MLSLHHRFFHVLLPAKTERDFFCLWARCFPKDFQPRAVRRGCLGDQSLARESPVLVSEPPRPSPAARFCLGIGAGWGSSANREPGKGQRSESGSSKETFPTSSLVLQQFSAQSRAPAHPETQRNNGERAGREPRLHSRPRGKEEAAAASEPRTPGEYHSPMPEPAQTGGAAAQSAGSAGRRRSQAEQRREGENPSPRPRGR